MHIKVISNVQKANLFKIGLQFSNGMYLITPLLGFTIKAFGDTKNSILLLWKATCIGGHSVIKLRRGF